MSAVMDSPIVLPWWRKPRWVRTGIAVGSLVLVAIAATTFLGNAERSVRMTAATLTISKVEQGVYHDFIPLRGKVVPRDTVYLDALEGGSVKRVLVEAGDYVTAGQPLVELSNTELELNVLEREAQLVNSITQLQNTQNQLEQTRLNNEKALAQIDYDIVRLGRLVQRRKPLVAQGVESKEVLDTVQDELNHAQAIRPLQAQSNQQQNELRQQQLPQIQAQLTKLQKDVEITRGKLDNLVVRAPVAGRMTAIDLKIGESRTRGERFGEITPDTGYKLSADINEYYLSRLQKNQTAAVQLSDQDIALHVTRVYPQVKDGTFKVDLTFDATAPAGLLPGQALQGKLALGNDVPGTVLPAGAFLERSGGDWVFVLEADRQSAQRRRIKLGRRNAEQVEVLSGLRAGEEVITSDYTGLERIDRVDLAK
ncbi:MAG: HlyD family efflux transporter periplasmic adaptor subunit [Steroidobacteraceae bacterium]